MGKKRVSRYSNEWGVCVSGHDYLDNLLSTYCNINTFLIHCDNNFNKNKFLLFVIIFSCN